MMKRIGCIAVWMAVCLSPRASMAQDLRQIEPYFVIVVDSSMSMEELPKCECDALSCANCLPKCSLANDADGVPPENKKNRWAIALEALTGTFKDFQCEPIVRDETTVGEDAYDNDPAAYPYHQPWDCRLTAPGKPCLYTSVETGDAIVSQRDDGIIDQYGSRIRFGLMTFDGQITYRGAASLVEPDLFDKERSNGIQGMWSYGENKNFAYPGCKKQYVVNSGVRSAVAAEGGMVTLNSCIPEPDPKDPSRKICPKTCSGCPGDAASLNVDIQRSLLMTRPYGSTPIAAALSDLGEHLRALKDDYKSCRKRYALLLTDGQPDHDYHDQGCDCGNGEDEPPCAPTDDKDPMFHVCPYPRAKAVAEKLVRGTASEPAVLERLFVVGMSVDNTEIKRALNDIAEMGCKADANCDPDGDKNAALFANDFDTLLTNLNKSVNELLKPVSRSVTAFATDPVTGAQYEISAGYKENTSPQEPWAGRLERKRFTCNGSTMEPQKLLNNGVINDKFHEALNANEDRNLVTAIPRSASDLNGQLTSWKTGSSCGAGVYCDFTTLASITNAALFGATDATHLQKIKDWMQGGNALREEALADVYHSSPVVVGPPRFDTADEGYNLFRTRPDVSTRPLVVYVATSEGVLHAFSLTKRDEDTKNERAALTDGQELWGFVPPLALDNLQGNLTSHKQLLDGTPVARDVFFDRDPNAVTGSDGKEFHTVLVTGTRGEEKAYFALDVTEPQKPKFLWQFQRNHFGTTIGQAAIGQARFKYAGGTVRNRAIALLPGGMGKEGSKADDSTCTDSGFHPQMVDPSDGASSFKSKAVAGIEGDYTFRKEVRCWKKLGRSLFIVDVQTGELIRELTATTSNPNLFPSPLVSTPSLYPADIGALATRAFVTDADGVIWRIDLSSEDPEKWVAYPFHDMFWDNGRGEGRVSYEAPLLSVDESGQLVILAATGDTDDLTNTTAKNRVVSLTEYIDAATATTVTPLNYKAMLNWELAPGTPKYGLATSELITGKMALFEGQLYFGSFIAARTSEPCGDGQGRIFATHYRQWDKSLVNEHYRDGTTYTTTTSYGPMLLQGLSSGTPNAINVVADAAVADFLPMGLSITQRPSCAAGVATDETDLYGAAYSTVTDLTPPAVYLVAEASGDSKILSNTENGELKSLQVELTKKQSFSRVTSWATIVD